MQSPEMAISGRLIQGIGGLRAGNAANRQARAQAREVESAAAAQELRVRHQARKAMGEQVAQSFANGMQGGSGSALDALTESQINAELDAMTLRREAAAKASAIRTEGRNARSQGQWSLLEGVFGAGSALAGMRDDWAQARRGTTAGRVA
ncbi:hypothetical protein HT136_01435 [Novosphingobium profundi]|uniref:hypothetical protein n=1 Tax=Novosphingobium profundi TaxID=1774954 RepID=UPI001BDA8C54|nr:hypothetical protein [Novosphingobium profundi]MBT0667029.1 hypothetical protein [Novosphingobium profundi]